MPSWQDLVIGAHLAGRGFRSDSIMDDALEIRRKRLRYRAWHRGTKELDLLIGSFADRHIAGFDGGQLDRFEALLECPEPSLYAWLAGQEEPPPNLRHDVMELLLSFKFEPRGA